MANEVDNKSEPKRWVERIRRTERANKDKRDEAMRLKQAYIGEFKNRAGEDVSKYTIKVNFIYYFIETVMASVFGGEPKVIGKAKKNPAEQKAAELWAYNTNYWARELDTRSEFRDAIFDSFFGPAAIFTGWDFETVIEKDEMGNEVERPVRDQPQVRWLNFFEEVRVDPDVLRTRRARWMARRITETHDEFIENQSIKEEYRTGEKAIKPTERPEDLQDNSPYARERRSQPSDPDWVSYWEVWDRSKMQRKLVHESCSEFLNANDDYSWPFELEYKDNPFPITILHAKEDPFSPISISEFRPIEDQIWERVRLRSVQGAIARRSAPKYLFQKGAGTKEQINKLQKSDLLSANELNDISKFTLMPAPEIPQGFYQWDGQLAQDLGNSSGLAEFENQRLANTATEASIAEGRGDLRRRERLNKIEDFVVTVLTKMGMLCQQLQTRETTFMIDPENLMEGEPEVFNVTREQIQGEFNLEMIAGSMEHVNTESLKRDLLKFLEVAAQSGEANIPIILSKIAELLNLDPQQVLITPEDKQAQMESGKDPAVAFDKIKYDQLDPISQRRVLEKAYKEAGIETLSPGPAQAAMGQLQALEGGGNNGGGSPAKSSFSENVSQNMVGNQNPVTPVNAASMEGKR